MRLRRTRAPAAVVVSAVTEAYTAEFSIPLTVSWIPFVGVRAVFFDVDLADGDRTPGSLDVSFLVTYRWASGGVIRGRLGIWSHRRART